MLSAGILLFIFWDVMDAAHQGLESSLEIAKSGGGWGAFAARSVTLVAGLAIGALGLAWIEQTLMRRRPRAPMAGGSSVAAVAGGPETAGLQEEAGRAALVLGMLIAVAIGLHNFSEGLAIGVSARAGTVALATTLIVGFALHNATEGFGIVGPLNGIRPSWRWLFVAGLVGGGPTFLGTLVGYRVTSPALEICFYALAAGAIVYVVGQLWTGAARRLPPSLVLGGIVLGFSLGMASDLVITYGGG
ncbi:MAG TPA: ZIP family metal transporter [Gaiellales bacterium]|nr:ZIP family metal transporter [Gaiellales bacterium]